MSVLLNFSIEAEAFQLGRVLDPPAGISLELERVVPMGSIVRPLVWVTGEAYHEFEETVRTHSAVKALTAVDRYGEQGLYRLEWIESPQDLLDLFVQSEAIILEGWGDDTWKFRLRFDDHDKLSTFHNAVVEQGIPIHIERTYTLTGEYEQGHKFDLTPKQREALVVALRQGYFASPSEVELVELADYLGVTRQAVSKRIRLGNEKVLRSVLLSSSGE